MSDKPKYKIMEQFESGYTLKDQILGVMNSALPEDVLRSTETAVGILNDLYGKVRSFQERGSGKGTRTRVLHGEDGEFVFRKNALSDGELLDEESYRVGFNGDGKYAIEKL